MRAYLTVLTRLSPCTKVYNVMFCLKGFTYMCTIMKFLCGDWPGSKTFFTMSLQIRCNYLLHSWFAWRALESSTQQRSENIFKSVSTRCKKITGFLTSGLGGLGGCGHRIDRVHSFFSSRPNWDSPAPSHVGEYTPLPLVPGGHALEGERGWGGVPIRTRGPTLWYSRYICTLWVRVSTRGTYPVGTEEE